MDVYWLEQIEPDVPVESDWLGARETLCLSTLRFRKRRADWLLGRWTAKCMLATWSGTPAYPKDLAKIEIRAAPSGAPEAYFQDRPAAVAISISHRDGRAFCTLSTGSAQLGCDLEAVEPRSNAFVADYFVPEEQALVGKASVTDRAWVSTLIWSAKESALKALQTGLRLDTRSVVVTPSEMSTETHHWHPLQVRNLQGQLFNGWWQLSGAFVKTVVCVPSPQPPILLKNGIPGECRRSQFANRTS